MKIKRLQQFVHIASLQLVKVTKVFRPNIVTRKKDVCLVTNIVDGKLVRGTARYILSDSLRRKYALV